MIDYFKIQNFLLLDKNVFLRKLEISKYSPMNMNMNLFYQNMFALDWKFTFYTSGSVS